jgi:hypothetical protein
VSLFLPVFLVAWFSALDTADSCDDYSPLAITSVLPGSFSFTEAKAIDFAWNLVAGRGLQGIMAMMLYGVATSSLLRLSENWPVSFEYFATVSLYPSSFSSVPALLKGIFKNHGWRSKVATFWIFMSSVVIISVPSLLDAMTGYVAEQDVMVKMPNGAYVKQYDRNMYTFSVDVEKPVLNGTTWILPFDYHDGKENLVCTPLKMYSWGFSSIIYFCKCVLLAAWGIGTWGLWLDAQHNAQQQRKGRQMTPFSAMYDIAEAVKFELGNHISAYSGQEIEKQLSKRRPIMYTKETSEEGHEHIRLSAREGTRFKLSFHETYG